MDKTKKRTIYLGIAVVVVLLLYWGMFSGASIAVETAAVSRGKMLVTVEGEGKTRIRGKQTVTAPVSGKLSKIKLTEGDRIPHDFPVAAIDPNPPLQRTPDMNDDRPSVYSVNVYAPIAGKVLRVFEKSAVMVASGTPLIELGDPDNLEFVVDILSAEAVRVRPGMPVLIDNEAQGQSLEGRVKLLEPQAFTKVSPLGVEEQRVNIVGDFLSNKVRLGDNFRLDLRIVIWDAENVLKVPTSALFRSGDDWNAFVVEGGRARRRTVRIGQRNAEEAQVLDGLNEDDMVIVHPPNQLSDGSSVSER